MADGLVKRLRPIIPEHLLLVAESGGVTIADPSLEHAWCHVSVETVVEQGDPRELVETAASSVLSMVQDFVIEWAAEPWPDRGGGVGLQKSLGIKTIRMPGAGIEMRPQHA